MRWLLSYICPPLCVLSCGKPFSAILNVFYTLCLWKPGVKHAQFVLDQYLADKRTEKVIEVTNHPAWTAAVMSNRTKPLQVTSGQCANPRKPAIEIIDDPAIGMNGTKFRKRSELN